MKILKTVALFEGVSLISLFFIAMPLKYMFNMPVAVKLVGPIHGVLFLAFIGLVLWHFLKNELTLIQTLVGIVASFVPFGTFIYQHKFLK